MHCLQDWGPGTYTVLVRYYNQNCLATAVVTLVVGGGVSGSSSNADYCSGDLNGARLVEEYYIPFPEDQILTALDAIKPSSCGGTRPGNPITSYTSVGVVESGTKIYYDHWEDGFEANLNFPVQTTTEIWGDNDPSNGIAPGYTIDRFAAGDIVVLYNTVDVNTLGSVFDFDGGDKIASIGNLSITKLGWASNTGAYMAGALEVYNTAWWGSSYQIPVGENRDVNSMFEYTGVIVMACEDNTTINIDRDGKWNCRYNYNDQRG